MDFRSIRGKRAPQRGLGLLLILSILFIIAAPGPAQTDSPAPSSLPLPPIRAAAEVQFPPFCDVDENGEAIGFSVELLEAAVAAMGREVVFQTGPWAEVRSRLERREVQALPLVARTPDREALYDFTIPYLTMHGAIVVRKGTQDIRTVDDLEGRTVAVMKGDSAEEFLRQQGVPAKLKVTTTLQGALRELSQGRHDAVVMQRLVALRLIQLERLNNLKVINRPVQGFKQDFCFAVAEGDQETLALLSEGLALVKADGTYHALEMKWFSTPSTSLRIVVGGDHNYPPFEYLDDAGEPAGYNVELTRAIARETGVDIDIHLGPWTEIREGLETGAVDAIQGIFYTPERDLLFDFTPPHLVNHCVAVVREGTGPAPGTIEELGQKSIVVQDGDVMHDFLIQNGLESRATALSTQEIALREVSEGRQDCALVSRISALYWIQQRGWTNLVVGGEPLLSPRYCYAVPNGQQALLAQFSEGLKILEGNGEYRRIYEKWLGVYSPRSITLRTALRYGVLGVVPLLVVLLLVFLWSWSLRKQVALQTQALRSAEAYQRAMVACSPVALYSIDVSGNVIGWNASAERIFGWTADEVVGHPLPFIPEDKRKDYEQYLQTLLAGEMITGVEVQRCRKNGEGFWGSLSAAPMYDSTGAMIGIMGAMEDITERKHAEEALKHSEGQFRSLVEGAPDAIFIQTHHRFAYANTACLRMLKADGEQDLIGKPVLDFFHVSDQAKVRERIHLLNEEKKPVDLSLEKMVALDGSIVSAEITAVPFYFEGDAGALVFVRDVRDRIKAEAQLEESERRFRLAVEEAPFPIMIHAEDGAALAISSAWRSITGYQEDELATVSDWTNLAYGPKASEVQIQIDDVYNQSGPHQEGEFEIACKDGSRRIWDFRSTPLGPLPDGRRVAISMAADVTDRKQAEARIDHLNRVLRAIRDINQLITRERDRNTLISEACRLLAENRSYSAAFIAVTDNEDAPIAWAHTGSGQVFDVLAAEFAKGILPPCCLEAKGVEGPCLISDRAAVCGACPVVRCDDTTTLCIRLRDGESAHGYLAVTLDFSLGFDLEEQELFAEMAGDLAYALNSMNERFARIRAESDREELQSQLLQAQKMEAIGQLAGGVAHDFNNILQAIMGHAQLLENEISDEGQRASVEEIFKGTERAADLTRQLLAFSRRQILRPVVLDINSITERFLKMIRRIIGEHIHLEWIPGSHLGSVQADPGMLEQVLMNLCVNARDAMPEGGSLTIETQNVRIDSEYCASHIWARPGRYVMLSITDTGCGIDDEHIGHIFEPFFTTKAEGKGTGLGLATVYGIVNQHEGMIQAYSELNKGTTLKVYLPICERRAESVGPLVEGAVIGGTETILLAEDDEMVRNLAKTVLERGGYTVLTANDGEEAVSLYKAHRAEIALLLFDVVMPRLGGHAALERIHAIEPGVPVLFSSGYSENAVHTNFVLHEGLQLIQKPYSPADLLRAIRSILDSRSDSA